MAIGLLYGELTAEHYEDAIAQKKRSKYPIGHRRRCSEGIPVLEKKYHQALLSRFPKQKTQQIYDLCFDADTLAQTPVNEFMDLFLI